MSKSVINGLLQLLAFQVLGELASKFLVSFIPGPVVGLMLLLVFLAARGSVPTSLKQTAESILQHLALLFIPASAGVVMFLPLLRENLTAVLCALVISVVASIGVTALCLRFMGEIRSDDEHAP